MPVPESVKRAQRKYEKKVKKITIRLNPDIPCESDMIDFLEESGNKQGTIKDALTHYMKKDGPSE